MAELKTTVPLKIRFSEVDSMHIVWHGHYATFFEDAREAFGRQYGLGYMDIYGEGFYAPLVEMSVKYRKPVLYDMNPDVTIYYRPTDAAKIVFDYEITDHASGEVLATGHTVQVFMDMEHLLVWANPEFYLNWKRKWNV